MLKVHWTDVCIDFPASNLGWQKSKLIVCADKQEVSLSLSLSLSLSFSLSLCMPACYRVISAASPTHHCCSVSLLQALWERALSTAAADLIASAFFALTKGPWGLDRISTVHLSAHHCSFIHSPVNIICCCPLVTMVELHPAWALVSPINESNGSWKTREREIPTSRSVLGTIERIIWLILWIWKNYLVNSLSMIHYRIKHITCIQKGINDRSQQQPRWYLSK